MPELHIFDRIPLLVLFAIIFTSVLIIAEIGFFAGRRIRREQGLDKYPLESAANGTILGLLAFILAFSFGTSSSRLASLRDLARQDNRAVTKAYMHTAFLPLAERQTTRTLLHEYHRIRLDATNSNQLDKIAKAVDRSQDIHHELWPLAVEARQAEGSSLLNPFVASIQEVMDLHSQRVGKALGTRLPTTLWATLFTLLALSSLMLGFSAGLHGRRSRFSTTVVILCFSAVILMIIDLDRPIRSLFQPAEDPTAKRILKIMESRQTKSINEPVQ